MLWSSNSWTSGTLLENSCRGCKDVLSSSCLSLFGLKDCLMRFSGARLDDKDSASVLRLRRDFVLKGSGVRDDRKLSKICSLGSLNRRYYAKLLVLVV